MKIKRRWVISTSLLTLSAFTLLGLLLLPATGQEDPGSEGPGPCPADLGDINRDGSIDLLDVVAFEDLLIEGNCSFQCEADINQDGSVNLLDFCPLVDILNGGG